MSLRVLVASLVGATVLLVCAAQFVITHWFASVPTMQAFPAAPMDAKAGSQSPASNAYVLGNDIWAVPKLDRAAGPMRTLPASFVVAESDSARADTIQRMLLLSVAAAGVLALAGTLVISVVLRRPLAAILNAIGDIERGVPPPKWAFGGPSELRTVGTALAKMGTQLQNSMRERELMLASLTHDLRSPLARLRAALELRADQADDSQLCATLREVDEIAHIISQCADYARDGRDEPLVLESLDQVVARTLRNQNDITLELASPAPFPMRALAVARAIRNLVDNARRHGGTPIRVVTSLDDARTELRVEDGGPGISTAEWPRLTQPFTQGGLARNIGGSGLGLAIVQRIAMAGGGELLMRPRDPQRPFCVILRFPRTWPGAEPGA